MNENAMTAATLRPRSPLEVWVQTQRCDNCDNPAMWLDDETGGLVCIHCAPILEVRT